MIASPKLVLLGLLISALSITASPVPAPIPAPAPVPQLTSNKPVAPVDCTGAPDSDVCTYVVNGDGVHTVDEFSGHLGRQGDIVANTGAAIIDEEGGDGSGVSAAGAEASSSLGGRRKRRSLELMNERRGVIASALDTAAGAYPSAAVIGVGNTAGKSTAGADSQIDQVGAKLPAQGEEVDTVGTGVSQVGAEADYQFGVFGDGAAVHAPESANAIDPDTPIPGTGEDL